MKNAAAVFLSIAVFLTAATGFAADRQNKVRGVVTSMARDARLVTIKPPQGDELAVIMDDEAQLLRVREGDEAEVRFVVRDGVNAGRRIRRLVEGCR